MTNKYVGAAKFFANLVTGGGKKTTGTEVITSLPIAKNLKKRFDTKQDIIKSIDEKANPNVSNQKKSEIKLEASKKVSKIYDKHEKKAKGGRVGLKRGTNLMSKKKSNVQKIQETFGPGKSNPKKSAAKKKKFPDMSGDGQITKKDILMARGVIPKPKKKVI